MLTAIIGHTNLTRESCKESSRPHEELKQADEEKGAAPVKIPGKKNPGDATMDTSTHGLDTSTARGGPELLRYYAR